MERLDVLLVKRGLATSRERAREMITEGRVTVTGKRILKAAYKVEDDAEIVTEGEALRYVSRGGLKLEKAVDVFKISLDGCTCLDIGASTGGFTDCMLQNGAEKVFALDVGHDQLAEKLRNDPRVISMEQTNIRSVSKEDLGNAVIDFISVDVSFISLTKVLPEAYLLLKPGGHAVCLIKPQFEAGKAALSKKGIIKDDAVRKKVVKDICAFAEETGFIILGTVDSPIRGGDGNVEYLVYLEKAVQNEETIHDNLKS